MPNHTDLPHLAKSGAATQLIVDGRPMILLAGEVHNSAASDPRALTAALDRLVALHCNAAIVPVYWEMIEPREDEMDFSLVDQAIVAARQRGLRLVLLWFGTWKNALSSYAPAWVKTDLKRFPRAQTAPGKNSMAISALSDSACIADARAFAALMAHVRAFDSQEHTVVMVQVENETGLLGAARDHSPLAVAAFAAPVPPELMSYLSAQHESLGPELAAAWKEAGGKTLGTWAQVFGAMAEEVFMAWHVSRFVGPVANAGKQVYPLPMFANAWLIWANDAPGKYPSGGPVMRVLDIWRAGAPAIDLLAPDIYLEDFRGACADFARRGNALLVPEARRDERSATACFYAFGAHDALCFAPFGLEDAEPSHPIGRSYELLAQLMPMILEYQGTGRMTAVFQQAPKDKMEVALGGYRIQVEFTQPMTDVPQPLGAGKLPAVPGGGLLIALTDEEFLVIGLGFSLEFFSLRPDCPNNEFLALEEGWLVEGKWVPGRRLNGDESGHGRWLNMPPEMTMRRVRLHCYE